MTEEMEKEMKRLDKLENKNMDSVIYAIENFENLEDIDEGSLNVKCNENMDINKNDTINTEEVFDSIVNKTTPREVLVNKIKPKNTKKIFIVGAIIFFVIFAVIFAGISLSNKFNSNVYKGVMLGNKDLSGMSETEVVAIVKSKQEEIKNRTVKVEQGDSFLIDIDSSDFGMHIDEVKTVENIMKFGRNNNIVKDNIEILLAMFKNKNIDFVYKYDEEKLIGIIKEVKEIVVGKTIDDNYTLDEKEYKLIINKGKAGNTIDEVAFRDELIKSLTSIKTDKLKIKVVSTQPSKLDADVVYSKVVKEPKDAYIDKSGAIPKFISQEVGIGFDKEELKKIIGNLSDSKSAEIKLIVTQPKVKLADITWDLYNYQVSTYKTYFPLTDPNRVNNLKVALDLLNGKVVMPGEIFSYNSIIGSASAAQGFKEATAFVGGTLVKEVGGGICQTVSTMYNTALLADLEIVQRKNHSLPVGYVPGSRDATVYYPSVDFKFKNTRNYPIKIVTAFNEGGNLSISFYGTKEEVEPVVTISSSTLSYISYKTEYIQDSSLGEGVEIVDKKGTNGYISEAYKTTKKDGKTTTVFLSKDTYKPVTKVVRIGTKVDSPVVAPVTPIVETPVTPVVEPVVTPPTE